MESLRSLLIKNQSYLGKLRVRALYCTSAIVSVESDTHKQYGPFSGYWDEWYIEADEMNQELRESITATSTFLLELRDFIISVEQNKKLTKSDKAYVLEVTSLAEGKLIEQQELLSSINERIDLHRQLTEKLLMVEAIDSLSDE
jgi:hypothetical protein